MIIYHGSNQIVSEPRILTQGFYKDFGYGFYCNSFLLERSPSNLEVYQEL